MDALTLQNPIIRGAITGLVTAMLVDYAAFRGWKSYEEARTYDWRVALWRWFQGLIGGAVTAAGLEGVS